MKIRARLSAAIRVIIPVAFIRRGPKINGGRAAAAGAEDVRPSTEEKGRGRAGRRGRRSTAMTRELNVSDRPFFDWLFHEGARRDVR